MKVADTDSDVLHSAVVANRRSLDVGIGIGDNQRLSDVGMPRRPAIGGDPSMSVQIDIPKTRIDDFCRRNGIRRLALFGSVLRDDFTADSDVDVLVEFEPATRVGMIALAGMEIELGRLPGRKVEMHTVKGLHPRFRDEVLGLAEVQYEQA